MKVEIDLNKLNYKGFSYSLGSPGVISINFTGVPSSEDWKELQRLANLLTNVTTKNPKLIFECDGYFEDCECCNGKGKVYKTD